MSMIRVVAKLLHWQNAWSWQVLSSVEMLTRDPVTLARSLLVASETADRCVIEDFDTGRVIARARFAMGSQRATLQTWSQGAPNQWK